MQRQPESLQEAIVYFSDPDRCLEYVKAWRWANGVTCPRCGSKAVAFLANQRRWQCSTHHPRRQFSVKVGTIFEDAPLDLDKWMVANCKNSVNSYEIARALRVPRNRNYELFPRFHHQ